jgi:hypothetical protein
VGFSLSTWTWVRSRVPQGSVLGPIMFLICIFDLGDCVRDPQARVLKYMDDTKVFRRIREEADVCALQDCLDLLYSWYVQKNMSWNSEKLVALRIGRNQNIRASSMYFTGGMEEVVLEKDVTRDLLHWDLQSPKSKGD